MSHKLLNDLSKAKDFKKLRNARKISNLSILSRYIILAITVKKYATADLSNFIPFPYFVRNILSETVAKVVDNLDQDLAIETGI